MEAFSLRRADDDAAGTARTKKLAAMRAEHLEKRAALQADEDLTPEAKSRRLQDLERDYSERREAEAARITASLDADIERADRKAHGPEKPSSDPQAEVAKELRLQRIRAEVYEDFMDGGHDPIRDYQRAVDLGDLERASVIGRVGPGFLEDPIRKRRLRELVEENEPESRRKAKRDLERLEREKRSVDLGLAFARHRRVG